MCLASHFGIILAHRGFTKKSIFRLIYASFDDLRVNSSHNAKWDKKRRKVVPGEEAGDEMFAMSGDTRLDNTLGMTTEEFAAHSKQERMKELVAIQLPRGGAGIMEAFHLNAGSSITGTVVEDGERMTAGVSLADKSLWTIDEGTLGRLGSSR